jgi:hypothetical protein
MTRTEDNAWYLLAGILMGMVLAFWFCPDIEFFRTVWPAVMVALIVWAVIRRGKDGKKTADKV